MEKYKKDLTSGDAEKSSESGQTKKKAGDKDDDCEVLSLSSVEDDSKSEKKTGIFQTLSKLRFLASPSLRKAFS